MGYHDCHTLPVLTILRLACSMTLDGPQPLLGGSWVVISGVASPLT